MLESDNKENREESMNKAKWTLAINLIFLVIGNSLFAADCNEDYCPPAMNARVSPKGIATLTKLGLDSAFQSPELIGQITREYPVPAIEHKVDPGNCSDFKIKYPAYKEMACDQLCTQEVISQVEVGDAWGLCPISIPRLAMHDGTALKQAGDPVPVSIQLPGFNVTDLSFGPSEVTQEDPNNYKICIPIEKLAIKTDVEIHDVEKGKRKFAAQGRFR